MTTYHDGHALLIGVGGDLPNTEDDARGLAGILADGERCAYPHDQVQTLTGPSATRDGILSALDRLATTSGKDATVIVYFSGHGYRATSTMGQQYYLMPFGYDLTALYDTAVSGIEFANNLAAVQAKRMLVLLDCCHAGGLGDEKSPGLTLTKAPLPPEAEELFARGSGRALIASSRANEVSFAGNPYSAFTLALIEALAGEGAAKQDGYVRWTDLALHAREKVPQRTKGRQHPIIQLDQADDFVLAFYAGGATAPKGAPITVAPEIEPEPGAFLQTAANKAGRDNINAQGALGFVNNPTGPVQQHFGNNINTSTTAAGGSGVNAGQEAADDTATQCTPGQR